MRKHKALTHAQAHAHAQERAEVPSSTTVRGRWKGSPAKREAGEAGTTTRIQLGPISAGEYLCRSS